MPSTLETRFIRSWKRLYPKIRLAREVRLIPNRKFRFDFVHFPSKVAIELNGGIFIKGGHSRGKAQQRDYEKTLLATSLGWSVINLGTDQVTTKNLRLIAKAIAIRVKQT